MCVFYIIATLNDVILGTRLEAFLKQGGTNTRNTPARPSSRPYYVINSYFVGERG